MSILDYILRRSGPAIVPTAGTTAAQRVRPPMETTSAAKLYAPYYGGEAGLGSAVVRADRYRVEHWPTPISGQTWNQLQGLQDKQLNRPLQINNTADPRILGIGVGGNAAPGGNIINVLPASNVTPAQRDMILEHEATHTTQSLGDHASYFSQNPFAGVLGNAAENIKQKLTGAPNLSTPDYFANPNELGARLSGIVRKARFNFNPVSNPDEARKALLDYGFGDENSVKSVPNDPSGTATDLRDWHNSLPPDQRKYILDQLSVIMPGLVQNQNASSRITT